MAMHQLYKKGFNKTMDVISSRGHALRRYVFIVNKGYNERPEEWSLVFRRWKNR